MAQPSLSMRLFWARQLGRSEYEHTGVPNALDKVLLCLEKPEIEPRRLSDALNEVVDLIPLGQTTSPLLHTVGRIQTELKISVHPRAIVCLEDHERWRRGNEPRSEAS